LAQGLPIARQLDELNHSRKQIEQEMLAQAKLDISRYIQQAMTQSDMENERPAALCLFDADWHQGVIGILASRVKDRINRPVIVFARGDEPNEPMIKGSARSVKGVHIRDVLAWLDARHPHLIEKFGGHAMAAGLSIREADFTRFAELFYHAVEMHLNGEIIKDEIVTDAGLQENELSLGFAFSVRAAGPWGQGFPEPLFDDVFEVTNSRIVGEDHLKLKLRKHRLELEGIYFRCPESLRASRGDKVRLVYKLDVNEFRGEQSLQLLIEQLEILSAEG